MINNSRISSRGLLSYLPLSSKYIIRQVHLKEGQCISSLFLFISTNLGLTYVHYCPLLFFFILMFG
uniref:Uncharacterized protein n=1 Tax=Lepeophtheirus salmonis TaxID=72036 RepID=A0A0K2T388_LEPSM